MMKKTDVINIIPYISCNNSANFINSAKYNGMESISESGRAHRPNSVYS